jgi:hypothetical protein
MDIRATRPRIITRIITPRPETNDSKVQAGGVKRNPFKRHDTCDDLKKSAEKANNKDLTRSVPSSEHREHGEEGSRGEESTTLNSDELETGSPRLPVLLFVAVASEAAQAARCFWATRTARAVCLACAAL